MLLAVLHTNLFSGRELSPNATVIQAYRSGVSAKGGIVLTKCRQGVKSVLGEYFGVQQRWVRWYLFGTYESFAVILAPL
jgi:hypothetical protein